VEEEEDEELPLDDDDDEEDEEDELVVVVVGQLSMEKEPVQLKVSWEIDLFTPAQCFPVIVPL